MAVNLPSCPNDIRQAVTELMSPMSDVVHLVEIRWNNYADTKQWLMKIRKLKLNLA